MKTIQHTRAYRHVREILLAPVDYMCGLDVPKQNTVLEAIAEGGFLGSNREIRELGNGRAAMYDSLKRLAKYGTSEERLFRGVRHALNPKGPFPSLSFADVKAGCTSFEDIINLYSPPRYKR